MKKLVFFCSSFLFFFSIKAQVTKLEHFNAHSARATELFSLFKTTFKLPVLYDYQSYGNFSSGGLWLGNISLEFVNYEGLPPDKALFKGLALEPKQHSDSIIQLLDASNVAHAAPVPAKFMVDQTEKTVWTNIVCKDLSSEDVRVFVCDYTDRSFVNEPKKKANDFFLQEKGGPLGILGLEKLIIGDINPEKSLQTWAMIPGVKRKNENTIVFSEGPEIILVKAEKENIREIVVKVRSLFAAADYLRKNHLLKLENKATLIDPEKLFGLRILLQD